MSLLGLIIREETSRSRSELTQAGKLSKLGQNKDTYPFENYEAERLNELKAIPLYLLYNLISGVSRRISDLYEGALKDRLNDTAPEPIEQFLEFFTRYPILGATLDTVRKIFESSKSITIPNGASKN